MNISKKLALYGLSIITVASLALTVSAQNYGAANASATVRLGKFSSTTRAENVAARQAQAIQRMLTIADDQITARINSLNNLISRIQSIKNVSDADKASITSTIQSEITTLTSLKAKIDADTSTTTLKTDLQSVTADYRVYALVEPQIRILAAADRVNQIVSLMTVMENKLQTRISSLQSSGVDTSSLASSMSDIASKLADATTQAANAVSSTASLVPDQGNTAVAASNTAALKAARADIKNSNSDLQAVRKDMNNLLFGIRKITPRKGTISTTTASTTPVQ